MVGRKSAVKREQEIGKLKTEVSVLQTRFAVLSGAYNYLREENLRLDSFDYQIKLLSKNLDEAQVIIDRLQNTAWRRFCRWVRLLFTV